MFQLASGYPMINTPPSQASEAWSGACVVVGPSRRSLSRSVLIFSGVVTDGPGDHMSMQYIFPCACVKKQRDPLIHAKLALCPSIRSVPCPVVSVHCTHVAFPLSI